MTDLEIIQNVFGNNDVSEKWLINMFDVCKSVREAEREACAKFIEQEYVRQFDEPWRDNLAKAIRARREQ